MIATRNARMWPCREGCDTLICITTVLQPLYDKWVTGRQHSETGGGQYFQRKPIREARRKKCKEFPRTPAEQYKVDKERVRYIRHLRIHNPNRERMFTHFVIGTQDSRNARMREYERVNGISQESSASVTAASGADRNARHLGIPTLWSRIDKKEPCMMKSLLPLCRKAML